MYVRIDPYESAFVAAQQELVACERQLLLCGQHPQYVQQAIALKTRIHRLKATIKILGQLRGLPLAESTPDGTGTLGDLVRVILSANIGRPMTVTQIRNVANAMGIQFKKYQNAASALTLTLRRLGDKPGSGVITNLGTHPMTFEWDVTVPLPSPQIPFPSVM
jgi:hypothetical protein